jgi:hypothetical protein
MERPHRKFFFFHLIFPPYLFVLEEISIQKLWIMPYLSLHPFIFSNKGGAPIEFFHSVMTSGRAGGLKNREPLKAD